MRTTFLVGIEAFHNPFHGIFQRIHIPRGPNSVFYGTQSLESFSPKTRFLVEQDPALSVLDLCAIYSVSIPEGLFLGHMFVPYSGISIHKVHSAYAIFTRTGSEALFQDSKNLIPFKTEVRNDGFCRVLKLGPLAFHALTDFVLLITTSQKELL